MVSLKLVFGVLLVVFAVVISAENVKVNNSASGSHTIFRAFRKVYSNCENNLDVFKCLKIQALKLTDRAMKLQNIKLIDGLSVIKKDDAVDSRSFSISQFLQSDIEKMPTKKIDALLADRTTNFMDSHQIQINVPRLLSTGQQEGARLVEEGRKKMKKYLGPFIAAVAIKAGILKMAYHSIAIVAGKALIIGKIALIISAIIGLKKLVTPEGHEKTTYEIVKHPHVQQTHSYSSSHGEYDGHEGGSSGSYHRSLDDDMLMQDRAYHAHVPRI